MIGINIYENVWFTCLLEPFQQLIYIMKYGSGSDFTATLYKLVHKVENHYWWQAALLVTTTEWQVVEQRGGVNHWVLLFTGCRLFQDRQNDGASLSEVIVRFPVVQNWRLVSL